MSHQTGIGSSDDLKAFFGSCRTGKYRLIKVMIRGESGPRLELEESLEQAGSWEEDWNSLLLPLVDTQQPAYFLYRLDEKDDSGFLWIFISWSPDEAPTRQKMLYASTKATFKKEFGQGQIKTDYFATSKEEVTLEGLKRHLVSANGPGPLSKQEEEMKEIKQSETRVDISVNTKQQTLSSLAFPMEEKALSALNEFIKKGINYVQLSIDISNESILLKKTGVYELEDLASLVPEDEARYHLYRFKHSYQGEATASTVFIYSMPGYSVSIKERMLYSSCKNSVVEVIENHYNIEIARKMEIDVGSELTEEYFMSEIHPVAVNAKPKFSKPAPPSKGRKRITKAPPS